MDIHPPEGPTHSFKDFAIHIGVVTIGILIALSLEGIRETIHEHRLVREARENFRVEILADQQHMKLELANVQTLTRNTDKIIADLPTLAQNPAQLKARVDVLAPSLYFFSSSSWSGALSSGALSHMSAEEVSHYAGFDFSVRSYTSMEDRVLPMQLALQSYVDSRKAFGPQEIAETEEQLRNYELFTKLMTHVGTECTRDFQAALPPN
jgi:hypothetical protein